jgi:hypothetical protein
VKLFLDVHHSPAAAKRLRRRGHDVLAAADDPRLSPLADEDLLRHATTEGRAIVTENVKDFDRIVRIWSTTHEHHTGVVFTSPRRFHRGRLSYPEDLVVALARLLKEPPQPQPDWVHWLE